MLRKELFPKSAETAVISGAEAMKPLEPNGLAS
jgi:hypothetical protein